MLGESERQVDYRLDMFGKRALTLPSGASLDRRTATRLGGDMADQPFEARVAISPARPTGASAIACIVFVGAMGAAFWIGAIWASQAWLP